MSYEEYLKQTGFADKRSSWIMWKMDICGMSEKEAIKAACDPDWGWEPLPDPS